MIPLTIVVSIAALSILNAVLGWFLPGLTRRDLYFAVTVAPGFRNDADGKAILHRYRTELVILSGLALLVFFAGLSWIGIRFAPSGPFLQIVALYIAFYRARQRALPHAVRPTTIREADLHRRSRTIPGGWIAASGPFILLAAGYALYLWIHSGNEGHGGASYRFAGLYFWSRAGILVMCTLFLYGLSHWVRSVHVGGLEGASEYKFRRTAMVLLLVIEYYFALELWWVVFVPVGSGVKVLVLLPSILVLCVCTIVTLARLGQGGTRMQAATGKSAGGPALPVGDRTLDHYWKLGIFYVNPDDPAVLVEKRFGLGYGLNFARPAAWLIVFVVLLVPLVPIVVSLSLRPKLGM